MLASMKDFNFFTLGEVKNVVKSGSGVSREYTISYSAKETETIYEITLNGDYNDPNDVDELLDNCAYNFGWGQLKVSYMAFYAKRLFRSLEDVFQIRGHKKEKIKLINDAVTNLYDETLLVQEKIEPVFQQLATLQRLNSTAISREGEIVIAYKAKVDVALGFDNVFKQVAFRITRGRKFDFEGFKKFYANCLYPVLKFEISNEEMAELICDLLYDQIKMNHHMSVAL